MVQQPPQNPDSPKTPLDSPGFPRIPLRIPPRIPPAPSLPLATKVRLFPKINDYWSYMLRHFWSVFSRGRAPLDVNLDAPTAPSVRATSAPTVPCGERPDRAVMYLGGSPERGGVWGGELTRRTLGDRRQSTFKILNLRRKPSPHCLRGGRVSP